MKNGLSPTAQKLFRMLLDEEPQTLHEIGVAMGIAPQGLYRYIEELNNMGLIEKMKRYPARIRAKDYSEALQGFLVTQRSWFTNAFPESTSGESIHDNFEITLITSRTELFEVSNKDLDAAQVEVDLIVSGFETPAETVLANKNAIQRGVVIKNLVQESGLAQRERFLNWKKLGVQVRACTCIDMRVLIFDSRIVYLVSYDPHDNEKATGVRIVYTPTAELMKALFDQKWEKAAVI